MAKSILVTGANGQLGREFEASTHRYPLYDFDFAGKEQLSISNAQSISAFLAQHNFDFCINCAAYTAVDAAESDSSAATAVNEDGAGNLAKACKENGVKLIHISTDYVFDGTATLPYNEDAAVNPINVYGKTKLAGEQLVMKFDPTAVIVRTSWLYSGAGKNFLNTMCRLMNERDSVSVVADQFGSPTYTLDLVHAVMQIISAGAKEPGVYHFSNSGVATWYDFAVAIKENLNSNCEVKPIKTDEYKTAAQRPAYSVLDTTKIKKTFNVQTPDWRESLRLCMDTFNSRG